MEHIRIMVTYTYMYIHYTRTWYICTFIHTLLTFMHYTGRFSGWERINRGPVSQQSKETPSQILANETVNNIQTIKLLSFDNNENCAGGVIHYFWSVLYTSVISRFYWINQQKMKNKTALFGIKINMAKIVKVNIQTLNNISFKINIASLKYKIH